MSLPEIILDDDFIRELEAINAIEVAPTTVADRGFDWTVSRLHSTATLATSGRCSCSHDHPCPLGHKGSTARCNADDLRDALLQLQKAQRYLRIS